MRDPTLLEILANKVEQTPELRSLVQTFSRVSELNLIPKSAKLVKANTGYEFSIAVNHKVLALGKLMGVIGRMQRRVKKPHGAKISVDKMTGKIRITFKFESFKETIRTAPRKPTRQKPTRRAKKS